MKFPISTFLAAALLLTFTTSGHAETRYISDLLVVTVRSGKSNNYQVLATLPTASPVEILEEDKTYVKVRTEKGIEGYVRKQYVSKAIPKSTQIAQLKKQKAALEKKLAKQRLELQEVSGLSTSSQTVIEQLTNDLKQSEQQLKSVNNDYTQLKKQSDNVINLTTERDQLLEENNQIISELQVLQEENKSFHRSNMIQWFLAGGGVFLVGWLVGKVSRKKRGLSRI
jgi:SH3 domain protein